MNTREDQRKKPKINVLIVDDHPLFREGLQKALSLEDDIHVVGFSVDGQQAIRMTNQLAPHVVLLDVNLPSINGLQVARHLKNERNKAAIIMLTAYHDKQQVLYAMRAGASAYCAKDVSPDDLVAIIRDVALGHYVVDDKRMSKRELRDWIERNVQEMTGPYTVDSDEHYIPLSPREMQILEAVTHGMSNKEIANELAISQQTVKNHMTSILRKLNVEDRTQAAIKAVRHGWVRLEDNQ